jgi:hypothetical protein
MFRCIGHDHDVRNAAPPGWPLMGWMGLVGRAPRAVTSARAFGEAELR